MSLNLDKNRWTRVALGDVVKNVNVSIKDPETAGIERIIAMEHLDPGELKISRWGHVDDGTTFTRRVKPGQTLFGKRRAYQRKAAYAEFDAITSGDILVFEADTERLIPELLPFLVQSDGFYDHALGTSAGSLSPRTNWRDLAKHEFDLPPLDEQKRLADLLWAVERLRQRVVNHGSAVLRARAAWLDRVFRTLDQTSHRTIGDLIDAGELRLLTGPFGSTLSAKEYVANGIPIIHPSHIRDGKLHIDPSSTVTDSKAKALSRWVVEVGDIILMRKGDVGRSAVVSESESGWILGSDCISVRMTNQAEILPDFLRAALSVPEAKSVLLKNAPGTTMPGINERSLRPILVPRISPEDQDDLLRRAAEFDLAADKSNAEKYSLKVLRSSAGERIFGGAL